MGMGDGGRNRYDEVSVAGSRIARRPRYLCLGCWMAVRVNACLLGCRKSLLNVGEFWSSAWCLLVHVM